MRHVNVPSRLSRLQAWQAACAVPCSVSGCCSAQWLAVWKHHNMHKGHVLLRTRKCCLKCKRWLCCLLGWRCTWAGVGLPTAIIGLLAVALTQSAFACRQTATPLRFPGKLTTDLAGGCLFIADTGNHRHVAGALVFLAGLPSFDCHFSQHCCQCHSVLSLLGHSLFRWKGCVSVMKVVKCSCGLLCCLWSVSASQTLCSMQSGADVHSPGFLHVQDCGDGPGGGLPNADWGQWRWPEGRQPCRGSLLCAARPGLLQATQCAVCGRH